jgi:O-antigen ligase
MLEISICIIGGIILFYFLIRPRIMLLILIFIMVNLDFVKLPKPINSLDIVVSSISIVGLILFLAVKGKLKINISVLFFFIYFVGSAMSTLFSPNIQESLQYLLRNLFYLLLMLFICNININKDYLRKIINIGLFSTIIPSIVAIYQLLTNTGTTINEDIAVNNLTRVQGTLSHPNFLAYFLMINIIICGMVCILNKDFINIKRGTLLIILVIDIIALLFTFTRGAIIGILIASFLLLMYKKPKVVWLSPLFVIGVINIPGVGARFTEIFNFDILLSKSSFYWRLLEWQELMGIFVTKNLIFGNGYKSARYFTEYAAHNEYLSILFETGIFGLIAFSLFLCSLLYLAFRRNIQLRRSNFSGYYFSYSILMIITVIVAFIDNYFSVPSSIFYFWVYTSIFLNLYHNDCLDNYCQDEIQGHSNT